MLGWEFPPHISGGLGTACLGLTRGLASAGVNVLFVVPRALGDEEAEHMELIGANRVRMRRRAPGRARSVAAQERAAPAAEPGGGREPAAPAGASSEAPLVWPPEEGAAERIPGALAATGTAGREVERIFEELALDSALRPYLDAAGYREVLRELAPVKGEPEPERARARRPEPRPERRPEQGPEREPQLALGPEIEQGVEEEPEGKEDGGGERFEFAGAYGEGLYQEVRRYAEVVAEVARNETFDLIHAHDWMTYAAGIAAREVSGKPLVLHLHASEYDRSGENVNERVRALEQAGFDAADLVVCVSHYTAGVLRRRYRMDPSRIRVVHNAVSQQEQAGIVHEQKAIDEPIVLFLGRVTFQKGPDYFIDAARRVVDVEPRVKFVMSGSGDMLGDMIERAARQGLARHIHFTGFLRGRDVERMYAMADIYVMPSVSEPFGISPLEAMALDVPVIVSRQSGVSEILVNALKVDFWDVEGLADKILALLRYGPLRRQLSEEGREEVRRMRWERRGVLMRDVYRELVPA